MVLQPRDAGAASRLIPMNKPETSKPIVNRTSTKCAIIGVGDASLLLAVAFGTQSDTLGCEINAHRAAPARAAKSRKMRARPCHRGLIDGFSGPVHAVAPLHEHLTYSHP